MKFKFCGGCNPLYDRVAIYEKVKNKDLEIELIILNGCHRGCKKTIKERNYINIQEFFITHSSKYWNEEEIMKWIHKESEKKKRGKKIRKKD